MPFILASLEKRRCSLFVRTDGNKEQEFAHLHPRTRLPADVMKARFDELQYAAFTILNVMKDHLLSHE